MKVSSCLELEDHLKGTFLESAPIIPVDSITGLGIDLLITELENMLEGTPVAKDNDRPRLWIDRVFTVRGSGTVVTGTLTGGSLKVDDCKTLNTPEKTIFCKEMERIGKNDQCTCVFVQSCAGTLPIL